MARRGQRDRSKERFWRRMVRRWRRSGQSVRAFCADLGLSEPSFYAWRRTLDQRDLCDQRTQPQPRPVAARSDGDHSGNTTLADSDRNEQLPLFVPLPQAILPTPTPTLPSIPAVPLELVLGANRIVRVPAGFDATTLRRLIVVLDDIAKCNVASIEESSC